MRHFPATLTREESDNFADRVAAHIEETGWGLWAVEVPGAVSFIGLIGLSAPSAAAHFAPELEIGWRLAARHQGKGYATEGALAAVRFGFRTLDLEEIVSYMVPTNASRRVMKKLGMTHNARDDFDHPGVPEGDPLRRHVLCRLTKARWRVHSSAWG